MGSMCCGCNKQIHMDYRSPVEKKDGMATLRVREGERAGEPGPLPRSAFIAFLGTLHQGWFSFTMHRFSVGVCLLQITKERMLLITPKKRMLQMQGEKCLNWLHSILGRFSTDFRKLL